MPRQRAARSRAVVATVEGLQPHDAVETMLAGMIVTHAHLLEDAAHDVFCTRDVRLKTRTESTFVALGRSMFGFLKELRALQSRRLEQAIATPGTAAKADAVPVTVAPPLVKVAEPKTGIVAADPPAHGRTPKQPVACSPSLRRAATSVAAMMAVLSPPKPAYVIPGAADKPAAAQPAAGHARPSAPDTSPYWAETLAA